MTRSTKGDILKLCSHVLPYGGRKSLAQCVYIGVEVNTPGGVSMTKRLLTCLVLVTMLMTLFIPTVAAAPIRVIIDGTERFFTPPPTLLGSSTVVPMRAFFQALGASVNYDGATKTITSTKGDINVRLVLNQKEALVNGQTKQLAVAAQLINGSTFVPLRFVGEALGATVVYKAGVITITSPHPVVAAAQTKVHFIDVGQGDSILIQSGDKTVLVDAGEADKENSVVNYLKAQGVTALDLVISTHPHADHIGELVDVLNAFSVARVIDSARPHTSQTYMNYLSLIQQKGIQFEGPNGQHIELGVGTSLEILGPVKVYDDLNNNSVVAKLTCGSVSFLLTGDMEETAELDLVAAKDLKATVLKVGHHGSSTSTSDAFLAEVSPSAAVISVGEGNSYGHPADETLAKLSTVDLYRTDEQGTIVFTTDGQTYGVNVGAWTSGVVTPPAVGKLTASATMSDGTPAQNSQVAAIVNVSRGGAPVQGAQVSIACRFKSTTSTYSGVTGSDGIASIPFSIGRATIGYTVQVEVTVTHNGETTTTSTSFTPR